MNMTYSKYSLKNRNFAGGSGIWLKYPGPGTKIL